MKLFDPDESPTTKVLGLTALVALLGVMSMILPFHWFSVAALFMTYEFWTLVNRYPHDTLSERIWTYKKRSIVPLLIGIAIGAATASGYLGDPSAVARGLAIGGLASHFFFTPEPDEEAAVRVVEAIKASEAEPDIDKAIAKGGQVIDAAIIEAAQKIEEKKS